MQAYALKRTIEKSGYHCQLINYKSILQEKAYSLSGKKVTNMRTLARNLYRTLNKDIFNKKSALFNEFLCSHLTDGQDVIHTKEEVIDELRKGKYDKVVVGSDQVWNTTLEDIDDTYLLDGIAELPKISYAASFGSGIGRVESHPRKLSAIRQFQYISVREKNARDILSRNNISSELVMDPVFLLNSSEWESMECGDIIGSPYILMYGFGFDSHVAESTKKVSRHLGLPVVNPIIHPKAMISGFINRYDTGPHEFLSLVKNAAFICTNSFHGTSFSIIYNKPFWAINTNSRDENQWDDRIPSLLNILGLHDRFVLSCFDFNKSTQSKIDYTSVNTLLVQARQRSVSFIEKSLRA